VCMLGTLTANAEEPIKYQVIMTDCGTVYEIPLKANNEQVAEIIDLYSEIDCE